MRLIHVIPAVSQEASGPSYSVVRLCESLVAEGNELSLAALDWAPLSSRPPFLRTFPLGWGPGRLGRSPKMYHWLRDQCESRHVDLLHNHGMWQMNAVYPAWAARRTSVRLMFSPRGAFSPWAMRHGSSIKRIFWPLLQSPALRQASAFHATAESEYHDIRRLGFRQPVTIIPNGIDLPSSLEFKKVTTDGKRTLLFLSRVHRKKGIEILLNAWREVQSEFTEWRLKIVGSDDGYHGSSGYLNQLIALSHRLKLRDVEFCGSLLGLEKQKAYQEAELFVLPTYSENFGVVVAEALAMETPAIVSKGAPWSGLTDQRAGWWIDIGVEPLVACLKDALARSPDELAAMGQRGRDWMQRDFSWDSIGSRMTETYRWLCDQSLPVPPWVRLD